MSRSDGLLGSSWPSIRTSRRRRQPNQQTAVGAIIRVKPVWSLAISRQLRYCRLVFNRPSWGTSRIVSASFSNDEVETRAVDKDDGCDLESGDTGPSAEEAQNSASSSAEAKGETE